MATPSIAAVIPATDTASGRRAEEKRLQLEHLNFVVRCDLHNTLHKKGRRVSARQLEHLRENVSIMEAGLVKLGEEAGEEAGALAAAAAEAAAAVAVAEVAVAEGEH